MRKIIHNPDGSITRTSSTGRKFTYKFRNFEEGGDTTQSKQSKKVNTLEGDLFSKVLMNRNKNLDFVQRAYALGENPSTPMFNSEDKTGYNNSEEVPYKISMSHKMAYDWDKSGQTYMFPSIYNPTKEAIKVPNQYADYISNQGYKKATEMNKFQQGGETESQKQKRLYEEMQKLPDPKISEDTHYDEVRKEWVPSMKTESTQPVAYRDDNTTLTGNDAVNYQRTAMFTDTKGNIIRPEDMYEVSFNRPKEAPIFSNRQFIPQKLNEDINFQPKGQKEVPQYKLPKPDIKRRYYEENGKYYMDFPDSKSKSQTIKRPISKETYRLGMQEQDEDLGIRVRYKNAGRIKKSC